MPVDASGSTVPVSNAGTFSVQCTSGCGGSGGTSSAFSSAFPADGTAIGFDDGTNMVPGNLNADGGVEVHLLNGGSGGTSSNFGSAFPSSGTAMGASDGTNMVALSVDGSGNLKTAQQGSVAVTGTFWQATQPVSAAALPLPSGAATETTLSAVNTTLGSPFQTGGSIGNSVFGATQSGSWSLAANQSVNVAQVNGVTPLMGAGNTGTGSPRVTIATDQTALAGMGVAATGGAVPANSN